MLLALEALSSHVTSHGHQHATCVWNAHITYRVMSYTDHEKQFKVKKNTKKVAA